MNTKEYLYFHRELSLGCFSETNQKRLTRTSPIEIYRARLPGNVRLVVSHHLSDLDVHDIEVFTSIVLTSSTNLEKMYDDILSKTVVATEHLWDSSKPKVLSLSLSSR